MNNIISEKLFEESKRYIPGGVNSPVRAFRGTNVTPPFIKSGSGSKITDEDGNEYIDYVGSWGPLILGHGNNEIVRSITEAAARGTTFGAPTELELRLAKMVCEAVPSVEMVRMVNSGTEATMSAIRLARGYTGRSKILKFAGNYHGHSDSLLIKAGSGALTQGIPDSPGVTLETGKNTLVAGYNDLESVRKFFKDFGEEIAGVIIEPIAGNMGVVPAEHDFLTSVARLANEYGALLIIDEVMTGFRVSYHGAQSLYGLDPDITCFGKIIGGGMPVGAYGGKKHIMERISPSGPVYQAGTLSGNPLAMAAGICMLSILRENPDIYEKLESLGARLEAGLMNAASQSGISLTVNRVGSMLTPFFTGNKVRDFESALLCDTGKFVSFFTSMLQKGIYFPPSQFESLFLSVAHSDKDIELTIETAAQAMKEL